MLVKIYGYFNFGGPDLLFKVFLILKFCGLTLRANNCYSVSFQLAVH